MIHSCLTVCRQEWIYSYLWHGPEGGYVESEIRAFAEAGFEPLSFGTHILRVEFAAAFITGREKPLALYYFGPEKTGQEVLRRTSSGGSCLNDTIMHIANDRMPFGGVGGSGMGRYHGRESFDAFSHRRAVLSSPKGFDLPFRYPPYKGFRWVEKIL